MAHKSDNGHGVADTPQTGATNTGDEKLSSSDKIMRDILRGLYEGRYVAGQRLVEPDLVSRYDVSRSTVREAIKRLASQGVVEATHNRGARIRQLSRDEARNILLITEVIIGLAARLAAANINGDGNRARMETALETLLAYCHASDKYEFMRARNRFHRTMAEISRNPELEQMLSNLQVHLVRNRLVMRPEDREASYRAIGRAILAGDEAVAEAQARAHVQKMIELVEKLYEPPILSGRD
ncbi:GntR family transcriptional regulator [Pararhodobacter sp.]|uniref:GntR family transcriptional regulator n=1 Tax=Pararhodobacter sp. TaxID=2127056 RepID=UPI002AFF0DC1|nr:GntR family transcriptional regulator [Pararhodobacter sp.]